MNERRARVLQWPHQGKCPVTVGERFELQSCVIEITRVRESIKAGADALWIAEFTRHEEEKPMLLRSSPPAHADHEEVTDLDAFAIKRAAAESAYTSSEFAAMPNEPESVGPDWEDKHRVEREAKRQAARKAAMTAKDSDTEIDRAADALKRRGKALGRKGVDLTDTLVEIYARLAAAEREAA